MKRITGMILSVLLAVSLVCPAASAASYYTDVPEGRWYTEAVNYVTERGLFGGIGGGLFDPSGSATRAMFVTVLSRVAGANVDRAPSAGFTDVPAGAWYTKAVDWACAEGYADGTGENTFSPNEPITREEIAVILGRYCTAGNDRAMWRFSGKADYADAAEISAEAINSVGYMRAIGLMEGSGGKFYPRSNLNRAETATIFMRLDQLVSGEPSFTLTTNSFLFKTFKDGSSYDVFINGEASSANKAYINGNDSQAGVNGFGYYAFKSSDPAVIQVDSSGHLLGPATLAENDTPVSTYIEVVNLLDGTRDRVEVTVVSVEKREYIDDDYIYVVDDDFIAAYAEAAVGYINQYRAAEGVPPVTLDVEAQECINERCKQLSVTPGHNGEKTFELQKQYGQAGRFGPENIWDDNFITPKGATYGLTKNGMSFVTPEELARAFVTACAKSRGHYDTMTLNTPNATRVAVGFYAGKYGHCAMWFGE